MLDFNTKQSQYKLLLTQLDEWSIRKPISMVNWEFHITLTWHAYVKHPEKLLRSLSNFLSRTLHTRIAYFALCVKEKGANGYITHIHLLLTLKGKTNIEDLYNIFHSFFNKKTCDIFIQYIDHHHDIIKYLFTPHHIFFNKDFDIFFSNIKKLEQFI